MSNALYQLPGRPGYPPGAVVEIAGPHDRYGKVVKTIQESYNLPNPSIVSGSTRLPQPCSLTLYLIRGTGGDAADQLPLPVWGFST